MNSATLTDYAPSFYRGDWVREGGDYKTNAFIDQTLDGYAIYVTKEGRRWFVFAEDHEPDELMKLGVSAPSVSDSPAPIEYKPSGFKRLYDAKAWAEAFGEWMEQCAEDQAAE